MQKQIVQSQRGQQIMSAPAPFADTVAVRRVLQWQLMAVTLVAFVVWFVIDIAAARASFLGALIAWASQAVFAWSVFRYAGARAQAAIVQSLFRGQFLKWCICFIGFMMVFLLYQPEKPVFVLLGFALQIMTNWGYVLFVRRSSH